MCEKETMLSQPVVRMTAPPASPVPREEAPAPRILPGGFVALPGNGEDFQWPTAAQG